MSSIVRARSPARSPFLSPSEEEGRGLVGWGSGQSGGEGDGGNRKRRALPDRHQRQGWRRAVERAALVLLGVALAFTLSSLHLTSWLSPSYSLSSLPLLSPPVRPLNLSDSVCVLARTYTKQYAFIPTFLSLLTHNQNPPHVFFITTDNTSSTTDLQHLLTTFNSQLPTPMATFLNVTRSDAAALFPEIDSVPEYGYAYSDVAISLLLTHHPYCRYLTITNADNIYTSGWLDRVQLELNRHQQLIAWDFISHHPANLGVRMDGHETTDDTRHCKKTEFKTAYIDLGAGMFSVDLWRQINMSFVRMGRMGRFWEADGRFWEHMRAATEDWVLIRQVLFVHQ